MKLSNFSVWSNFKFNSSYLKINVLGIIKLADTSHLEGKVTDILEFIQQIRFEIMLTLLQANFI